MSLFWIHCLMIAYVMIMIFGCGTITTKKNFALPGQFYVHFPNYHHSDLFLFPSSETSQLNIGHNCNDLACIDLQCSMRFVCVCVIFFWEKTSWTNLNELIYFFFKQSVFVLVDWIRKFLAFSSSFCAINIRW